MISKIEFIAMNALYPKKVAVGYVTVSKTDAGDYRIALTDAGRHEVFAWLDCRPELGT